MKGGGRGRGAGKPEATSGRDATVEAAGGVVIRAQSDGDGREVLVVHRPKYDDWSLPKGKLEPGESHEHAAAREVEEETGWHCELGTELPAVHYRDRRGRPKHVRYWLMAPVEHHGFIPNHEVDMVRWVPTAAVSALLSYDADRQLLAEVSGAEG
jgi:8-oxo-dGTP diphosphatase